MVWIVPLLFFYKGGFGITHKDLYAIKYWNQTEKITLIILSNLKFIHPSLLQNESSLVFNTTQLSLHVWVENFRLNFC